jgi:hypothetical protein
LLEFAEEPLDQVALAIEPFVEPWHIDPVRHGFDIGLGVAFGEALAQRIAVVSPIGEQNVTVHDRVQHVLGAASVMGLAFGDLQKDRQAAGIDEGMDFGGQPVPRTAHATGSRRSF